MSDQQHAAGRRKDKVGVENFQLLVGGNVFCAERNRTIAIV